MMDLDELKKEAEKTLENAKGIAEDGVEKASGVAALLKSYWWVAYVVIGFVGVCSLLWAITR